MRQPQPRDVFDYLHKLPIICKFLTNVCFYSEFYLYINSETLLVMAAWYLHILKDTAHCNQLVRSHVKAC